MKLLDLKSALLMPLHASALTLLTSVTTRQSRSELHSALAAPEVVLLRLRFLPEVTDYTESLLPVDEQECDMSDV